MAVRIIKPTTPGQRQRVVLDFAKVLTTRKPHKPLLAAFRKKGGRNNQGRITMRHQGGGHKKRYRIVDFKMDKFDVPATVETIEYDPNRSAFISLILFKDGERRYVLAPEGIKRGDRIIISENAPQKIGNRLPIEKINPSTLLHNIELLPGGGGKIVRSAGSTAQLMGLEGKYAILKMPSGEVRKINRKCWASIGTVSNVDWRNIVIAKAGRSRWLGIRPTVRGTAMSPVDHPYGGGEGKAPRGTRRPKTLWGKVTGGRKTRKKRKPTNRFIISRRPR